MLFIKSLSLFVVFISLSLAQEDTHLPDYLVFTKQFAVHVQVREPSGIMVWTRNSPLIDEFGLELYVGRSNHSNREPIWDRKLLVNTSVVVDGKFLIQDDDLMVKEGETIRYRFTVLHKKTLFPSNFRRIHVTDHLFYRPKNNYCFSECLVSGQEIAHEEAAHLKEILEQRIMQCAGKQATEYLFFPLENASKLVADAELYVKYRLFQVEALRPLVNNVVTTYLAHNGVSFRMYTLIEKFKVLELGKGYLDVIDFDTFVQGENESL